LASHFHRPRANPPCPPAACLANVHMEWYKQRPRAATRTSSRRSRRGALRAHRVQRHPISSGLGVSLPMIWSTCRGFAMRKKLDIQPDPWEVPRTGRRLVMGCIARRFGRTTPGCSDSGSTGITTGPALRDRPARARGLEGMSDRVPDARICGTAQRTFPAHAARGRIISSSAAICRLRSIRS
jgi:hypothetical protein